MGALPEKILLQVVTPERLVVTAEVDQVLLPGSEGYFGVLPGHTPFLTSLKTGEIHYRTGGLTRFLTAVGGFAEVLPDKVTVLSDQAEKPEEIDEAAAREAFEKALQNLKQPCADFQEQMAGLEMARARLGVRSGDAHGRPGP